MKIKSLLLLGLMAIGSMNAFAEEHKVNGVIYDLKTGTDAGKATVKGISTSMQDATAATITIPASFTDGDGNVQKVTGFEATWQKAGTGYKNVEDLVTAITVDVTNIAPAKLDGAFAGLNNLATVTLKGTYADADYTIGYNSYDGKGATSVTTVNLKDLKGKTKVILDGTAFNTVTTVTTVTLPEQATEISDNAFKNASALTAIGLKGVTKIGANAFDGCTALATVDFSNATALTEIGANAFKGVPFKAATATTIDLDLSGATALKTVATTSFPAIAYTSVKLKGTAIDDTNFANVPSWLTAATASLTEITFPDGITTIPAMGGFTALESVGLPKNLTQIGTSAFAGCTALKTIRIKNQVKYIRPSAFSGCTALANINFSDAAALEWIGNDAFAGTAITTLDLTACPKLKQVYAGTFPANAYTSVLLAGSGLVWWDTTTDPATYTDNFSTPFATILSGATASLEEITLPTELTKVEDNQFKNFTALKTIGLPKAVKTIGKNAFDGSGLTSIKIRENVELIDDNAFNGCADLATINFSEATALTDINPGAFAGTPITTIDLSACAKLNYVSSTAFAQNKYTSVKLNGTALAGYEGDPATYYDRFSNYFNGSKILANAKATLTEITLPGGLEGIKDDLFNGFTALTSVSVPKGVTTIGKRAFKDSGLTAFKVREKVVTIDNSAFEGCTNLAVVNFSEATALEYINASAFENTAVKEISIPVNADDTKTLTMGANAFKDCASLKSFAAKGLAGSIPANAFEGCKKLTGIVIQKAITSIGADAFAGCEALATVTFRHDGSETPGFTAIGASAFEGCAALAALDLSNTKLTNLDANFIFKGCTSLATITFPETLTSLQGAVLFADCPIEELNAPNVTASSVLFGAYWDGSSYQDRDADHANTTLKSVTIGGLVPSKCFAYCTALESVEYDDNGATGTPLVQSNAFNHCTALTSFTYEPEATVTKCIVDDNAFLGCIPFVHFVANANYMDWVVANNDGKAPVNTTFGGEEITKVKTVQDKANANQFIAKYVNNGAYPVYIDAADAKVFSIYVDGENAFFQACRTFGGKYYIQPAGSVWNAPGWDCHVIIKTDSEKEVNIYVESGSTDNSIAFDDIYDSKAGDDLAAVQAGAGIAAGKYLYRLTNTDDQGFGFTFFTGTTIKEGQFFVTSEKKPEGAGRLNTVWLDEDGNVIESEATAIKGVKKALDQNDGAIYNLQGVRVQKAVKGGIYIQNGKKFVVK